jgi:hypothetical protein
VLGDEGVDAGGLGRVVVPVVGTWYVVVRCQRACRAQTLGVPPSFGVEEVVLGGDDHARCDPGQVSGVGGAGRREQPPLPTARELKSSLVVARRRLTTDSDALL